MTARTLTVAEDRIHAHVLAINLGACTWCPRPAANACHRLPEGQGGPYLPVNLLPGCGSGTTGCHWRTEQARRLSYACGWLITADADPAGRNARIAAVPALIRTQLAPTGAWHWLDSLEDGVPLGMPSLADDGDLPPGMWAGSFADAVAELRRITRGTAA